MSLGCDFKNWKNELLLEIRVWANATYREEAKDKGPPKRRNIGSNQGSTINGIKLRPNKWRFMNGKVVL